MTDLHTHILPGIDDGARDIGMALTLLEQEMAAGVRNIALTSHFDVEYISQDAFLSRREQVHGQLRQAAAQAGLDLTLKPGAEVRYSPRLGELDAGKLCLEGTNVLLLELSTIHRPQFFQETLFSLQSQGIIPLLAHVERCCYIMEEPTLLYEWVCGGVYAQINASSLLHGGRSGHRALDLIRWGLAQVVATDTHSPDKRPPRLRQALALVNDQLGPEAVSRLVRNADALFAGQEPDLPDPRCPRRIMGHWF